MYNIAKEVIAQSVRTQSLGQSPSYIINISIICLSKINQDNIYLSCFLPFGIK